MSANKKISKFTIWLSAGLVLATFLFLAGFKIGNFAAKKEPVSPIIITKTLPSTPKTSNICLNPREKEVKANFKVFWEAWDDLKTMFYQKDTLTDKKLLYGAIRGLSEATKDPYTNFFPPQDAKKFNEDITGHFGGIGAEIGKKEGILQIIAPLKNTPAEKAGLKAGDKILKVDGQSTANMTVYEAVKKIRGPIGKKVVLTIYRDGWKQTKDFTIVRANIKIPSLDLSYFNINGKKVAYFQIYNFNQNLQKDFYKKALEVAFNKVDGIVLDLRNNPGGYLDIAVNIAGWFLKKGETVVKEKFLNKPETVLRADGNSVFDGMPVVILVNQGSASASEILTAALRERDKKVKVVGQTTFGKGSVQTVETLSDDSYLKITIAHWLTPNNEEIEGKGIKPDIEVKENEDAQLGKDNDNQLQKAKEVIAQMMEEYPVQRKQSSFLHKFLPFLGNIKVDFTPKTN